MTVFVLIFTVSLVGLQSVIVTFPGHTHLLFVVRMHTKLDFQTNVLLDYIIKIAFHPLYELLSNFQSKDFSQTALKHKLICTFVVRIQQN